MLLLTLTLALLAARPIQGLTPVAAVPRPLVVGRAHQRLRCERDAEVEFDYPCVLPGPTSFRAFSPDGPLSLELLDETCRLVAVSPPVEECVEAVLAHSCGVGRYSLVVRGPRPDALVHVSVVRGELDDPPLDPAARERLHWALAFDAAHLRGDSARVQRAVSAVARLDGRGDLESVERELAARVKQLERVRRLVAGARNWARTADAEKLAEDCWLAYQQSFGAHVDAFDFVVLPDLIDVFAQQRWHKRRVEAWARVLALFEQLAPRGHPQHDDALVNRAQILYEFGRFDLAYEFAERWLATDPWRHIDPNDVQHQRLRTLVGYGALQLGEWERARALFEAADRSYRTGSMTRLSGPQWVDFIVVQSNLVALDVQQDLLASAARRIGELGSSDQLPEPHRTRIERFCVLTRARLAWRVGKLNLAHQLLEDAAAARADERVRARTTADIELQIDELRAFLLNGLGKGREALELVRSNLKAFGASAATGPGFDSQRSDPTVRIREQRILLGMALAEDEQLAEAERELRELADELAAEGSADPDVELRALEQLAAVLARGEDWGGAAELEQQVLSRLRADAATTPHRLARALSNHALSLAAVGEREGLSGVLVELSDALHADLQQAVALTSEEIERLCADLLTSRDVLLSLAVLEPQRPESAAAAFTLAQTLRATSGGRQTRWRAALRDPQVAALRSEWRGLATRELDLPLAAQLTPRSAAELVFARVALQESLLEHMASGGAPPARLTVDALARALAPDAAAIGFVRYEQMASENGRERPEHYLAHCVRADGTLARVELGPAAIIDAAIAAHRAAILDRSLPSSEVDRRGERVRALVWDPLAPHVGQCAAAHVCLDDALHLIPFDALPLAGSFVGKRWKLRFETDFERLLNPLPPGARRPASLVALGGVDYIAPLGEVAQARGANVPERFGALPSALAEVRSIVERVERRGRATALALTGAEATKAAFLEHAPRAGVLHVATHAYAAAPEDVDELLAEVTPLSLCGLVLAGFNTAPQDARASCLVSGAEIATLDLSNTELAIVSTCNSALGVRRAAAGVASLRTAFHLAGARHVVSTLWSVDDAAALRFGLAFHEALWTHGLSVSQAFERARDDLRDAGAPVRDWGAWLLTGATD